MFFNLGIKWWVPGLGTEFFSKDILKDNNENNRYFI